MTNEQAIEILEISYGKNEELDEALEMAIQALEKDTPKKLIHCKETVDEYEHYKCPNCEDALTNTQYYLEYTRCTECGQTIDWNNKND